MLNIEVKFRVKDLEKIEKTAAKLSDHGPKLLVQEDTYFNTPVGRLKLRSFADGRAELIAYQRSDSETARKSRYMKCNVTSHETLKTTLAMAIGQGVTVRKRRTLYLVGQTRVHLDQVEQLGAFVELEVVMKDGQPECDGTKIVKELIEALGLASSERVAVSYCDLVANSIVPRSI